ncbi:hypothetical protein L6R52_00720 [Myxococcota bacterium]|nr:hypothetical protein [Myxococcota bacterium]
MSALVLAAPSAWASDEEPFGGPSSSDPAAPRRGAGGGAADAGEVGEADDDTSTIVDMRRMPLDYVARPLVTPKDLWVIVASSGFAQLDEESPVVPLVVGARYGVDGDLEVGLELLRLTMSPNPSTGLGQPLVHALQRLVGGTFELGIQGTATVPTGSAHAVSLALPMVLHARVLRLDATLGLGAASGTKWIFSAEAPAEVTVGLGDRLRLSAGVHFTMPDVRRPDLLVRPSFRAGLALPEKVEDGAPGRRGTVFDLGVRVTLPDLALHGERPEDPAFGNYFAILLEGRFFMPREREDRWDF